MIYCITGAKIEDGYNVTSSYTLTFVILKHAYRCFCLFHRPARYAVINANLNISCFKNIFVMSDVRIEGMVKMLLLAKAEVMVWKHVNKYLSLSFRGYNQE